MESRDSNMRVNQTHWIVAVIAVWAISTSIVSAKPDKSPVRVECTVPAGMSRGDEVDIVLRLRALYDLRELEVQVYVGRDVEIVSGGQTVTLADVAKDSTREVPVRVRLTGDKAGTLVVASRGRSANASLAGSTQILFGDTQ